MTSLVVPGEETETIQFFKKTGPTPHVLGDVFVAKKPTPPETEGGNLVFFHNTSTSSSPNATATGESNKQKNPRTVSFGPASEVSSLALPDDEEK